MGMRLFTTLLVAFLLTVSVLGGAGYAITRIALPPPRELFRAAGFDLQLAPGWWCELEDSEYVCSPDSKPPYPAIAIIAMKERSDTDNLAAYEQHLEQVQQAQAGGKNTTEMFQVPVHRRVIAGHKWVEALLSGSEVPNYDTYYLATNTSYLGILVTMSVHKDHTKEYVGQFQEMIGTLDIYEQ